MWSWAIDGPDLSIATKKIYHCQGTYQYSGVFYSPLREMLSSPTPLAGPVTDKQAYCHRLPAVDEANSRWTRHEEDWAFEAWLPNRRPIDVAISPMLGVVLGLVGGVHIVQHHGHDDWNGWLEFKTNGSYGKWQEPSPC
ncbi:hypothetical protein FIE12Z_7950 [Fusarium flagelliforme]|uniref:Uncharacterized protein n=1 Tax=Fusarium flagelliforme TaxID=2675880 RepID=A0A395MIK3_9HYPO|nr:hypothetical protein FIE12Z_7950 [Fusarium flagelliforme]